MLRCGYKDMPKVFGLVLLELFTNCFVVHTYIYIHNKDIIVLEVNVNNWKMLQNL